MSKKTFANDKIVQAVTFNLKEQRVLEKTLQTISLEEDYATKLLELQSREVKVNNRRLKTRISKIKSHLSADEIKELRTLEIEGKMKPAYNSVGVNGAMRIAAAAKRLKLGMKDGGVKSAPSTRPTSCQPPPSTRPTTSMSSYRPTTSMSSYSSCRQQESCKTPVGQCRSRTLSRTSRPASVAGGSYLNQDSPPPSPSFPRNKHDDSDSEVDKELCEQSEEEETEDDDVFAPRTSRSEHIKSVQIARKLPLRPATSNGFVREKPKLFPKSKSNYSSHDVTRVSRAQSCVPAPTWISIRRRSSLPMTALEDNFVKDTSREEKCQELLEQELERNEDLQDKQKDFLDQVAKWVKDNPSVVTNNEYNQTWEQGKKPQPRPMRRRGFSRTVSFNKRDLNQRRVSTEESWRDLNKCRYLRIADELVDLSGVVTLAKEQLKLYDHFRLEGLEEEGEY